MVEKVQPPQPTLPPIRRSPSPPNSSSQYFKPAPAAIHFGNLRFLITDRPNDFTLGHFIEELKKQHARDVVRVCQPSYQIGPLEKEGIKVHDWEFNDGSPPPDDICRQWFQLLNDRFKNDRGCCIAVHCVAGLGRAPVLVALALMEAGMGYEDAVETIRKHRRGAINAKQLEYLEGYRPKGVLKKVAGENGGMGSRSDKNCCIQ